MPGRTITAKEDQVIFELFRQCLQKNVDADGIAVWQHQEAALSSGRLDCTVGIAVFPDVMAWNRRTNALFAPAVFGFIDPTETRFILEHQAHFSTVSTTIVDFFPQFFHFIFKEGLIKSTCTDWRGNFLPCEAKKRRNTLCISSFFNEAGREISRRDVRGDLFRASLKTSTARPPCGAALLRRALVTRA